MPHVCFVSMAGLRVKDDEVQRLGMTLPGLTQRGAAVAALPSLALLNLAGMLPEEWTCSYRNTQQVDAELLQGIVSERPTLVAVSALTACVEEAYSLAHALRRENLRVVLGGLHATTCPDEASARCDAVVIGEGELVWQELVADAASENLQRVYDARSSKRVFEWPTPRYEVLGGAAPGRYLLQTQRGCPLACDFCAASRLLGPYREKPIELIQQEAAKLCRFSDRPSVELADDNTFVGGRDHLQLLDALAETPIRYFTESDWRLGEKPEVLAKLACSGCVGVLVGVESIVYRYHGMGSKLAEQKRVLHAIDNIQQAGVPVNACFILGADGETRASMDRLAEFILTSQFADVQVTLQTPFPGTTLRRKLEREGRLLKGRGWPYYTLFDATYRPDKMSPEELEVGFQGVLAKVFDPPESLKRKRLRQEIWRAARRNLAARPIANPGGSQ